MKYLLIVGVLMTSWTVQAQDRSIRFEEGSYQEVLAKAKKENKLLFIDCYTSWCGPPSGVTQTSSWPRVDHLVSRLPQLTRRPLQTRFRFGCRSRDP